MVRQGLLGSAALCAAAFVTTEANSADVREPLADPRLLFEDLTSGHAPLDRDLADPPVEMLDHQPPVEVLDPLDQQAYAPPASGVASMYGLDPADYDDVSALELNVARVAGALGMEVDNKDADLLGRVALHVVDDPRVGAPPIVTDATDPYLDTLEQSRRPAPVGVYDVAADSRGVVPSRGLRLDYIRPISNALPGELELAVEPRASVVVGEDVSGVGYGAIVRFGQNLTEPRNGGSRWYAFVGADAQALTWSLGGGGEERSLRLEDKQLIGDYQVGVARRMWRGDLALGFVHREVKWKDWSRDEQFVGVSYTMRH